MNNWFDSPHLLLHVSPTQSFCFSVKQKYPVQDSAVFFSYENFEKSEHDYNFVELNQVLRDAFRDSRLLQGVLLNAGKEPIKGARVFVTAWDFGQRDEKLRNEFELSVLLEDYVMDTNTEVEFLRNELSDCKADLEAKNEEIFRLEQENRGLTDLLEDERDKTADLEDKVFDLEVDLEEDNREVGDLEYRLKNLKAKFRELEEGRAADKAHVRKLETLLKEGVDLELKSGHWKVEMLVRIEELEAERDQLKKELNLAKYFVRQDKYDAERASQGEEDKLLIRVHALESELEEANATIHNLQQQLNVKRTDINKLQDRLVEAGIAADNLVEILERA